MVLKEIWNISLGITTLAAGYATWQIGRRLLALQNWL